DKVGGSKDKEFTRWLKRSAVATDDEPISTPNPKGHKKVAVSQAKHTKQKVAVSQADDSDLWDSDGDERALSFAAKAKAVPAKRRS
ncbi:unnamed protein product, partial [Prorocentrum cordatum]